MEIKSMSDVEITVVDSELGIVEHLVTVFGNIDTGKDRCYPGAFTKTLVERGGRIRVLDMHQQDSVLRAIGKPVKIWEVGRGALPVKTQEQFPDATGGVMAQTQFLMDTPEGKGIFVRIKEGAINEWSYGYDSLDADYETINHQGKDITVRNLRTIRLWEYGPVLWGMNSAAVTLGAKGSGPEEGKPAPDVTKNYVRIRVKDPGGFQEGSFRTIVISASKGIKAVIGKLSGETSTTIQSYLFKKSQWTVSRAQAWIKTHKKDLLALIEIEMQDLQMFTHRAGPFPEHPPTVTG
jgi:HK97 family phage prohead protease